MKLASLLVLGLAPLACSANEALWTRLQTEPNIIVLMRHMQSAGGKPLVWDETGGCKGEARLTKVGQDNARKLGKLFAARSIKPFVISSPMCRCRDTATIAFGHALLDSDLREIADANPARVEEFDRKVGTLLIKHRGRVPIVFVSHSPNIGALTMEFVGEGELVVGKISDSGDIEVLGKMLAE